MFELGVIVFLSSLAAVAAQTPVVATPTIPTSVFSAEPSVVSQALATASLTPDLGNPAELSTYPQCAQICSNSISITVPDFTDLVEVCGVFFRTQTAACEVASCSNSSDVDTTQLLAQQLCGPVYRTNQTLGSAVSSSIASATAEARADTQGKDARRLSDLPQCAQTCIVQNSYGGCGSLSNVTCICKSPQFNIQVTNTCEAQSCTPAELTTLLYLGYKLCAPVGGLSFAGANTSNLNISTPNGTTTVPPPPPAFTGAAASTFAVAYSWLLPVSTMLIGCATFMLGLM